MPASHRHGPSGKPEATELASDVDGACMYDVWATRSSVGPDQALYVTDSSNGRVQQIEPRRGRATTYADGVCQSRS